MARNISNSRKTEFYIENKSGVKLISSSGLNCSVDADEQSIDILRKIGIIEKHYDVVLCRPDELYERDLAQIDLLNDLIEFGYTDKLKLGSTVLTSLADAKKLKNLYAQSKKLNSFCLVYEGTFYCKLFSVRFSLGKVRIVAGKYKINCCDLKYKAKTFRDGDTRRIVFTADDDFKTFFVVDAEKAEKKVIIEPKYEIFTTEKLGLNWGFINEEE